MSEPSRRPSAFRLIASIVFVALVIGGLWLQRRRVEAPAETPGRGTPPVAAPAVALPPPPLDREALLEAVADAADAYAAGREADPQLVGRSFELPIVFGCNGPSLEGSAAAQRWQYDAETQALEVSAQPIDLARLPWVRNATAGTDYEAAEGFWIERPWQRRAACPRYISPLDAAAPLAVPRETLAIAELFAAGAPRSRQRDDRAYQIVRKVPPEQIAEIRGFRLVIEGRLAPLANGGAIGCWSPSPDVRPICLVSANFERIRIEEIGGDAPLAEWRP